MDVDEEHVRMRLSLLQNVQRNPTYRIPVSYTHLDVYKRQITKKLTVSGNAIKHPQNVTVPVGVPVNEIVEACGGYTCDDVKLIAGGPMMGKTIVNDKFVIDRNMNAITILANKPYDSVACLRCGKCSDHCLSLIHISLFNLVCFFAY